MEERTPAHRVRCSILHLLFSELVQGIALLVTWTPMDALFGVTFSSWFLVFKFFYSIRLVSNPRIVLIWTVRTPPSVFRTDYISFDLRSYAQIIIKPKDILSALLKIKFKCVSKSKSRSSLFTYFTLKHQIYSSHNDDILLIFQINSFFAS